MIPQWAGWLLASSIGIVAVVVFILLRKTEPLPQEETPSLPRATLLTLLWPETERQGRGPDRQRQPLQSGHPAARKSSR